MIEFDAFLETLEQVPAEFERNFNLIRELDNGSNELFEQTNDLIRQYKATRKAQERREIKSEIDSIMNKLTSYANDKLALVQQIYDLIDKRVVALIALSPPIPDGSKIVNGPIVHMPVTDYEPKYCYCHEVSYGDMIACDSPNCPIEWFHLACLRISRVPKGKWFCPECQKEKSAKRSGCQRKEPVRRTPRRRR